MILLSSPPPRLLLLVAVLRSLASFACYMLSTYLTIRILCCLGLLLGFGAPENFNMRAASIRSILVVFQLNAILSCKAQVIAEVVREVTSVAYRWIPA